MTATPSGVRLLCCRAPRRAPRPHLARQRTGRTARLLPRPAAVPPETNGSSAPSLPDGSPAAASASSSARDAKRSCPPVGQTAVSHAAVSPEAGRIHPSAHPPPPPPTLPPTAPPAVASPPRPRNLGAQSSPAPRVLRAGARTPGAAHRCATRAPAGPPAPPPFVLSGHAPTPRESPAAPNKGPGPQRATPPPPPPPRPPRTKWTRRVPHPVLIGHAASLGRYAVARGSRLAAGPPRSSPR